MQGVLLHIKLCDTSLKDAATFSCDVVERTYNG